MAIDRGPWNALIDDDGSNLVGSIWNKAAIKTVLLDPIDASLALTPPPTLQTYQPEFRAGGGSALPIGTGTLTGFYQQTGKVTWVHIHLTFGSTTPGPTGAWSFSLPFVLADGVTAFAGLAFNGSAQWQLVTSSIGYAQEVQVFAPGNPMTAVTNTVPFTWSPGCHLAINGTYRAA